MFLLITTNRAFSTNPSLLYSLTSNAELFSLRFADTGRRQYFNKNVYTEKVFIEFVVWGFFWKGGIIKHRNSYKPLILCCLLPKWPK